MTIPLKYSDLARQALMPRTYSEIARAALHKPEGIGAGGIEPPVAAPRDVTANVIPSGRETFDQSVAKLPQPTIGPRTYQTATVPKLEPTPLEAQDFRRSLETPKHIGQEGYQLQDVGRDALNARGDFGYGKPAGMALDATLIGGAARSGAAVRRDVEQHRPGAAATETALAGLSFLPFGRAARNALKAERGAAVDAAKEFAETFQKALVKPIPPDLHPDDYVNVAKFALDPGGETRLRNEVARVVNIEGLHPKQRVSWDETKSLAESIGLDKMDLDPRAASRLSGPEMLAARNVVSNNIDALDRAYQARQAAVSAADLGKVRQLDQTIQAIEGQNQMVLSRFVKSRTATGRDLNNLKILANRTMDPVTWMTKAQSVMGDELLTEPMRIEIARFINEGDRAGLVKYIASLRTPVTMRDPEFWTTLRKAGLLLNVPTHLRNFASNVTMGAMEMAKDAPAALVDAVASVFTGQRTKSFAPIATVKASQRGAREGVTQMMDGLRGMPDAAALQKLDIPHETNFANPLLDAYTKFSFRAMGSADRPFKTAAIRRSLGEQARVIAREEGTRGAAFAQRVAELENAPTNEMALRALADAEHATFQNPSIIGDAAVGFKRAIQKRSSVAGAAADIIVPFTRTPGAVAGKIAEYSPLGFLATPVDAMRLYAATQKGADKAAVYVLQKKMAERFGRAAFGTTVPVLIGYALASQGKMTGATPDDPGERSQWGLEGKQSDAVLYNGRWYKVTGISPVGNLMAFGAQLYHNTQNPEMTGGQATAATAGGMAKTLREQTFLKGVMGVSEAVDNPKLAQREVSGQVGSFVPSAVAAGARAADPLVRAPETPAQAVASRIPGLSRTVPPSLNALGEPIERDETAGKRAASAFLDIFGSRPDRTADDPLLREMARVGATVTRPAKKRGESDEQYTRRQIVGGQRIRQVLTSVIQDPGYQRATAEQQKAILETVARNVRSGVTRSMIPATPSAPPM